jgi:hypothetical protein
MATYPRGRRPARPFAYFSEVMNRVVHYIGVQLLQEGPGSEALRIVRDIRARYDGRKRNPFDEAECGHHYARALASWGLIPACTGFHYSAREAVLAFATPAGRVRWPWAADGAWGVVEIVRRKRAARVNLTVLHGRLTLQRLELAGYGQLILPRRRTLAAAGPGGGRAEPRLTLSINPAPSGSA